MADWPTATLNGTPTEVAAMFPLIALDGGPQDGWVYNPPAARRQPEPGEWGAARYDYAGVVVDLGDGRTARLFQFAGPDGGTDGGTT